MIATERDIELLLETILHHSRPERVYLFGSQGRSDAHTQSDVDLLIVERSGLPPRQRGKRLTAALRTFPALFDLLFYTPQELYEELRDPLSFAATVVADGQLIYGGGHVQEYGSS